MNFSIHNKREKNQSSIFFLVSWGGLLLVSIYLYISNDPNVQKFKLLSLIILVFLIIFLVLKFFLDTKHGYLQFVNQNIIEMLIFTLVLTFFVTTFYKQTLIFISLCFITNLFVVFWSRTRGSYLKQETSNQITDDYRKQGALDTLNIGEKKLREDIKIQEAKKVIKSLLAQLGFGEETSLNKLVSKTAEELSNNFKIKIKSNNLIVSAIHDFLDENPYNYEYIKLREVIRKVE